MNIRQHFPLAAAAIVFALAVAQAIHPFEARVPAGVLFLIAALFGLRYLLQRQTLKYRRGSMHQEVPQRPLGIEPDDMAADKRR